MTSGIRRAKNGRLINLGKFFSNISKGKPTKSARNVRRDDMSEGAM